MKFRFLGGMDCPDWLLSMIAASAKLSAIKYRGLCQLAVETVNDENSTGDLLQKYVTEDVDIRELRRILMSLSFIIRRSAGYLCAPEDLEAELVQLGLPPEHSKMLNRVFAKSREAIKEKLQNSIQKEEALIIRNVEENDNVMHISYQQGGGTKKFYADRKTFQVLLNDMRKIEEIIQEKFSK